MSKPQGKYSYLFSNTLIFTISTFSSKLITVLMLPLYTGILTPAEYGVADIVNTTVMLALAIITLSIKEAVIRFTIDKSTDPKKVLTNGILVMFASVAVLSCLTPLIGRFLPDIKDYIWFFVLIFSFAGIEEILFKFAKGIEKVKQCAVCGIISSITTVAANIIYLLVFRMGLEGYLLAIATNHFVTSAFLFFSVKIYKYIKIPSNFDKPLLKEMVFFSIPLIPTAVSWWINSMSSRYIIIFICGAAASGLYSIANRIPSIINIFVSIFQQAWQLSGVKEYQEEGYESFFLTIYNLYSKALLLVCSLIMFFAPIISVILFKGEFFEAWKYVPFLLFGTTLSAICGVLGTIFTAAKKTQIMVVSTFSGAVINILVSIFLVNKIGTIGAAIATVISFLAVWVVRYFCAIRIVNIGIDFKKNILIYAVLFVQAMLTVICPNIPLYMLFSFVFCCIIIALDFKYYISTIRTLYKKIFGILHKKLSKR